jgi:hypothetical protein
MADAQYIIEIATAMPDGPSTIAELDDLTSKLMGAGRRSDDFQAAVKRLATDLDAAKLASAGAAAALAAGNEQYKLLEVVAIRAAKAVEKAQAKGQFDPKAARAAGEAQIALDAYAVTLRKVEVASEAAKSKQDGLAKVLGNVNKIGAHADARTQGLNQKYEKLQAAVSRLPGPLGRVGSALVGSAKSAHGVSSAFTSAELGAVALVGALVAVAAVAVIATVAFVAGYASLVNFAVGAADAARTAQLSRDAFAALSAETAAGVGAFDAISAATGLADKDLFALTKQLKTAGVGANEMQSALRAAALAERALGAGGAGEFISKIQSGELAVKDFARTAEEKFGGIVADQLRGLDAQGKRFDKLWSGLFAGINVEPFLSAVEVLVGMFDKANPLAQAFGAAVEGAVNPIGPMVLKAAYAVEAFALGAAIQFVKMYLAIKPVVDWLGKLFASADGAQGQGLLNLLELLGKAAAVFAVVFGGALLVAVGAVGAVLGVVVGLFASLGVAIYETVTFAWSLVTGLVAVGTAIVEWATTVGADLMAGLVTGIVNAVSSVVAAVTSAVSSAIDAAKAVLGIASPSKVFAEIGTNTVLGFTGAVDAGAGEAQGSMAALVTPEARPLPVTGDNAAPSSRAGGGGGKTFDFAGATFTFHGVANAESARDLFAEMFTRLLEDDATSLGGAMVGAT